MLSRRMAVLAFGSIIAAAAVGCAGSPAPPAAAPAPANAASADAGTFFETLRIEGDEVEGYDSLEAMAASATAVVVGHFDSFEVSRVLRTDMAEDTTAYGKATLRVTRVLRGDPVGDTVPVEFVLPATGDQALAAAAELDRMLPHGEMVVFLRAKRGSAEAGLFRLVNSHGLWASTARSAVDAPLAEEVDPRYTRGLDGVASLDQLADRLAKG
jgi:hypothetical protein